MRILKNWLCAAILLGAALAAQAAEAPGGWTAEDAALVTPTGTLHGTALIPAAAGKGAVPVVLLHAGSGPTDRDGNSKGMPGTNDSLRLLAEALASRGVATVRFDKRGIAASTAAGAAEEKMRFEHYVGDAADWVRQLRKDARFSRVIVAGHSEGALIGMLAARQAGADAYVSIAGIAAPADKTLSAQLKPALPPALFAESEAVLASLKAGKRVDNPPPSLAALYRPSVQPYLISWFAVDPAKEIATLTMPVLILQGGADIQVPVGEAAALGAANPAAKVIVIAPMNHVLKMVGKDAQAQKASYVQPDFPVSPELVDVMAAFATARPPAALQMPAGH